MIRQRVLSALVIIPLIFVIIWFGGPAYSVAVAAVAAVAALEFYGLMGLSWRHPLTLLGLISVLLFILVSHFEGGYAAPLLTLVAIFPLIWLVFRSQVEDAATKWAWCLVGIIYIGWILSHLIPLRGLEAGRDWVLFTLFATFAVDTAAFFTGRFWGRHPLASKISPGKTWEGAIGGFAGAMASVFILAALLPGIPVYWHVAILGALIGVFAQLGDLSESLLKRSVGVKDSGSLIPGHGGLLDRLDSVIFTVVVVYYYVIWVVM